MRFGHLIVGLLLVAVASCSHTKDGPRPQVAAVAPEGACNDQLPTTIAISGAALSPLNDHNLTTSLLELPQITLTRTSDLDGNATSDVIVVPNDPRHPELGDETWTSQQAMGFSLCPPGVCSKLVPPLTDFTSLPPGLYTLTATNKNGHSVDLPAALTIVPIPILTRVDPDLLCEDKDNTVTITGDYFIRYGGAVGTLTVGDKTFTPSDLGECRTLPSPADITIEACKKATVSIPAGSFTQGTYFLTVTGPAPVGCHSVPGDTPVTITFVREPSVATVVPDLMCDAQGDRGVTVNGADFLTVDGVLPTVHADGTDYLATAVAGCVTITGPGLRETVQQCTTLTFSVKRNDLAPVAPGLDPVIYPVTVTNPPPADGTSHPAVNLVVVAPPAITAITPDVICDAQGDRSLVLSGTDFVVVNGTLPAIHVGLRDYVPTGTDDCTPLVVPGLAETVQRCRTLRLTVAQNDLPPLAATDDPLGYPVTITNPPPAGCTSEPVALTVIAPPAITTIEPDFVCNGADQTFTLTGRNFVSVATGGVTATPSVTFANLGVTVATATATPVAGSCALVAGPTETVQTCTKVTVVLPAGTLTASGTYAVTLTNPAPVGCLSTQPAQLLVVPPPTITAVAPPAVCAAATAPVPLAITGTGFIRVNGPSGPALLVPAVTVIPATGAAVSLTGVTVDDASCTVVGSRPPLAETVESCTRLTAMVPAGAVLAGVTYRVQVSNPTAPGVVVGGGCSTAETVTLQGTSPPAISNVAPLTICTGGGIITVTGTGFEQGATVTVGPRVSTSVVVNGAGTSAVATFGAGPIIAPAAVTLTNPSGCSATATQQVSVVTGPILVFADPAVVWNGMSTPVTLYLANQAGTIGSVSMTLNGSGNAPTPLTFSVVNNHAVAVIPSGTAAGSYDLLVSDASGCPAVLANAVRVTATQTLALAAITPSFGWVNSSTDVTITATGTGFGPLPKVYLVKGGTSTLVGSVDVSSPTVLTGVIPAGLAAGGYDVVVVNPDGTVGVLTQAFTVNTNPPPVVTSITPSQAANSSSVALLVTGGNFRGPANPPAVELRCVNAAGATLAAIPMTGLTFTPGTPPSGTIHGTVATPAVAANCIVHVTNADDGSSTDFASFVVTMPSQNLTAFNTATQSLATGRRALGVASGGPTNAARFVYAVAGDNGTNPLASVEVLPVDIFGKPGVGGFFTQRNPVQQARTQTKAVRIGRFIYLVGGGSTLATTSALDTVERAVILDASTAPTNLNVGLDISTVDGVAAGVYFYRVAAIMGPADPFNPGGETLPSASFGVNLPPIGSGYFLRVVLSWNPVPGAVGYRIYRTAANAPASTATLLADTTALPASFTCSGPTTCTDAGATPGSQSPHAIGATGTWATIAPRMITPRQGAGVTWAPDPASPTTKAYLYVLGGLNATGARLTSGELLPITIAADGSQTFGAFTATTASLSQARWRLSAWTVTPQDSTTVGVNTWVWAGGGASTTTMPGALTGNIEGAQVQPGTGQLLSFAVGG
ncbi:MAG TPA: hypothetical protein VGQ83_13575, partial [Polyangia bacterium]